MSKETHIVGNCYLSLAAINKGSRSYPRWELNNFNVRKTKPDVASNEVALKLSLKLPVALFEKPLLAASINIEGDVPVMDLTPETVNTVQDLIRSQTGLDVELTVVTDDD